MRFLNRGGELDDRAFTRTYGEEVVIALSAFDCILNGEKAVYCSSELTTGKRLNALYLQFGVRTTSDLRQRIGEEAFRRLVWDPNVAEANAFARDLHHQLGGEIAITPAPFVSPGWGQPEYLAFWETVIRTRCKAVYFSPDWEYSSGCAFEFSVARDEGLPTFYADGREMSFAEGRARIAATAAELAAEGLDVTTLLDVLARLDSLQGPKGPQGLQGHQD
jgi:hypothetical protein